jgi:membrane fusion protein, multidrug efflux system
MRSQNSLFLALALVAAVGIQGGCKQSANGPSGPPIPSGRDKSAPVPVTTSSAIEKDVPIELRTIGTARAFASVSIKARVDGQLARVAFKQGDEVKRGDVIFEIDKRPFLAVLNQVQAVLVRDLASLTNAEADMRRTDELAGTKAVPQTLVDANRAKVATLNASIEADKAVIESAQLQLSFCTIAAPVDGRMGLLLVDEGNMVKNNDTILAVINQLKPIYVDFAVPERSLQEVRHAALGGRLRVEAAPLQRPGRSVAGELEVIDNQVDVATGTLLLRAKFPNGDEALWPGQFLNVQLTLGCLTNAVVVPASAVQAGQNGDFVFVVDADRSVAKRPVTLGPVRNGEAVIQGGLKVGETVVTDGQLRLVPGAKVDVRTPGQPASGESRGSGRPA